MKKLNRFLSVCLACLLLATATVAGTLAYEYYVSPEAAQSGLTVQMDSSAATSNVQVGLVQQQRAYDASGNLTGLENFEDDKILVPLVESAQYDGSNFDRYGMPTAEGYVDQIVRVKNSGTQSAYVRVIVAIPAALDDANDAGKNALHWNLGNRFMPEGNFTDENNTNAAFGKISWKFSGTAVVDGVKCNIYTFTYTDALAPGATTDAAAFVGFYLDSDVNVVDGKVLLNGVDTGFADDSVKIHVKAQGVQSDGFDNAEAAFAGVSTNPWAQTEAQQSQ